jgi:hypothetical protein
MSAGVVKVVGFKAVDKPGNGLVAFCDLAFTDVVIHGAAIRRNAEGQLWVALPSKAPKEEGGRWQAIVSFRKDAREGLQAEIVRQVETLQKGGGHQGGDNR